MLTNKQKQLAQALLARRPAVVPGTRVIVNDAKRTIWYDAVTETMKHSGITGDDIAEFCDLAGVAD